MFGVSAAACREILSVLGAAASPIEHYYNYNNVEHARACCACALLRASATVARSRVHLWHARDALLRDALSLSTGFGGGAAGGGSAGGGSAGAGSAGEESAGRGSAGGASERGSSAGWSSAGALHAPMGAPLRRVQLETLRHLSATAPLLDAEVAAALSPCLRRLCTSLSDTISGPISGSVPSSMWRADVNKRRRTDDALRGSNADNAMRTSNADDALRVSVTRALVCTFSQILRRRPLSAALEEETKAHAVRFLEASFESEEGAYARRITSVLCLLAEADEEPRHIEQAAKPTERGKPPGGAQSPPELSSDSRGGSSGESPTEPSGAFAFSALRRLARNSARVAAAQAFALAACCRGTAALEAEAVPLIERLEALAHGAPADDGGGAAAANDAGGAAAANDAGGGRGEAARIGQMLAAILRRAPVMEVHMERIGRATQRAAHHDHPSVLTPLLRACWAARWAVRLGEGAFSGRFSAIQGRRARGEGWGGATTIALEGLVSMRRSMRLGSSVAYNLACEAMQAGEPRCAYALLEGLEGGSALSPQARVYELSLGDSAISPTAAVDPSLPTPYLHPILAILAPHTCQISDLIFSPAFPPLSPISPTRTFRIFSTRTCVRPPIPNLAHRTRTGSWGSSSSLVQKRASVIVTPALYATLSTPSLTHALLA